MTKKENDQKINKNRKKRFLRDRVLFRIYCEYSRSEMEYEAKWNRRRRGIGGEVE